MSFGHAAKQSNLPLRSPSSSSKPQPSTQSSSDIYIDVFILVISTMDSPISPLPSTISPPGVAGPSTASSPSPPPVDLPRVLVLDFYDSYTNNLLTLFGHYPDDILLKKVVIIKQDQFNWYDPPHPRTALSAPFRASSLLCRPCRLPLQVRL